MVDRNSLFQRRGRVPDKSTVKPRFRAISVTMRCCNTNVWRHYDSLATRLLRGVVSSDFPALGGVRVAGESAAKSPRESGRFRIMAIAKSPTRPSPKILGTFSNARGWIRTNDPRFRRPMLYPAELRMQGSR